MSTLRLNNDNEELKTFPRFLRSYANHLVAIEGKSEKTVCEYLLDLRTFFRYMVMLENDEMLSLEELESISIKHLTIDDANRVDTQMIIDFIAYARNDRHNNSSTRNRKLSAIKSFFKHAYNKKHLIDQNPAADIDGIKASKALSKFLTIEEAVKLLETVNSDIESKTRVRDYSIIALFLNTGMRLSELVGLNVQSFDPELSFVKVVGKGNKERFVYFGSACRKAIDAYMPERNKKVLSDNRALFGSRDNNRISVTAVHRLVKKALLQAGLDSTQFSAHKLRHTAATMMLSGGVDVKTVQEVLGHENLNTTQIYTHIENTELKIAAEANPLSKLDFSKEIE